ncbi:MAG: hypothetical protein MUF54_08460 [Polyangiaceae bacterium]|jgi:hypothetical protein|nr:hypothetical protein [Polyangiaceae bacterium]
MSNTGERHSGKLDDWLGRWPVPARDEHAWDALAAAIEARVEQLRPGSGEDEWFATPLPLAPGEPGYAGAGAGNEVTMQQESQSERPKKKSLKEIAQRVSVGSSGPPPPQPSSMGPPRPASDAWRLSTESSPGLTSSRASLTSRPAEAADDDSGVLDLHAVREAAASFSDTGKQPASEGLFDEEAPTMPRGATQAAPSRQKRSSVVPIAAGGIVSALALAAALVFVMDRPDGGAGQVDEAPVAAIAEQAPDPAAAQTLVPAPADLAAPAAASAVAAADELEREGRVAEAPSSRARGESEKARSKMKTESPGKALAASEATGASKGADEPAAPANPNDLAGAMAGAVGAPTTAAQERKDALTGPDPGTIPEKPSQGALQGAVGAVMGDAKACVAGMSEPSRASVTFGSNGRVSGVAVSGPAASTAAAGCIKSALGRARVGPFKQPSVNVSVTIRP